jgi:hypothetical protein
MLSTRRRLSTGNVQSYNQGGVSIREGANQGSRDAYLDNIT